MPFSDLSWGGWGNCQNRPNFPYICVFGHFYAPFLTIFVPIYAFFVDFLTVLCIFIFTWVRSGEINFVHIFIPYMRFVDYFCAIFYIFVQIISPYMHFCKYFLTFLCIFVKSSCPIISSLYAFWSRFMDVFWHFLRLFSPINAFLIILSIHICTFLCFEVGHHREGQSIKPSIFKLGHYLIS